MGGVRDQFYYEQRHCCGGGFLVFSAQGRKAQPNAGSPYEAYFVVGVIAILGLGIGLVIDGATGGLK
jgi:hypothetical protein